MGHYDQSSSSQSSDSNFEIERARRSRSKKNYNFEKNYPKNILISILESLKRKGYQALYESEGIFSEQIQKRNSASLVLLHKILTHPLMKQINKSSCEILASNYLLQNSKICKKAFHLKKIQDVFSFDSNVSLANFKSQMKKKEKKYISKEALNIEIFLYQSSTIYLLTMFLKAIEDNPNLSEQSFDKSNTQQEYNGIQNHDGPKYIKKQNRELSKPLVNILCLKLCKHRWNKQKFEKVYDMMRGLILETEQNMIQKLKVKRGMPYLRMFCPEVIQKCFDILRLKNKVTSAELNELIKNYEELSLQKIARQSQSISEPIKDLIRGSKECTNNKDRQRQVNSAKEFYPIILTRPF